MWPQNFFYNNICKPLVVAFLDIRVPLEFDGTYLETEISNWVDTPD